MAVTVTDRRTILAQGDATTETGGIWNTGAATAVFAESGFSIAVAYNIATGQIYFDLTTPIDLTDTMVYVYSSIVATKASWTTGPHSLFMSDATNDIAFHETGNDRDVFKHADGPVDFQCFLLDMGFASAKNTAGETTIVAGSFANFIANVNAIDRIGAHYITLSKALGGGVNCYCDIIRYGNDGLRITAGGVATEGTFLEIATEDRSTATIKAHGIIRELTTGVYGCQGPMTFGESGAATTSYFLDSSIVLAFEDRDVNDDKYYFNVEGNSGVTNFFEITDSTITTAGPFVTLDFSAGNVDTLTLTGVVFTQLGNSITFSNVADATGHTVDGCSFVACGQIDPGDVTFSNNLIQSTTALTTGALLLDEDNTANISNLSFVSGGTGYAVQLRPTGAGPFSFDLDNWVYSGYANDAGTAGNRVMYINPVTSTVDITLNIQNGGDVPSVDETGYTGTLTIVNAVTVRVEGVSEGTAVSIRAAETVGTITTGDTIFNLLANASGVAELTTFNYEGAFDPSGLDVIVRARQQGLPNAALQSDNGVFTDYTAESNSTTVADMIMYPAIPVATEDSFQWGHAEQFGALKLELSTVGVGGFVIVWEYWNGAWVTLTVVDGTSAFTATGVNEVSWTIPGDWAASTDGTLGPYYYVRARYLSGTMSTVPLGRKTKLDVTRYLPFVQNRIIESTGLTVVASWVEDVIATF